MADKKEKNPLLNLRGRGTGIISESRFDRLTRETDLNDYGWTGEDEDAHVKTEFLKDSSRTIVTENKSPDIPFRFSINAYRGCEHGCAYCYARPTHEYLGLSAGLDFETKIFVKEDGPALLREKLMSKSWKPEVISISGVTDCYQPAEKRFELTRKILQVLAEFRNPVGLITKNQLVTRDIDILSEMASENLAVVYLSVTTLDADLGRKLEPRTSSPEGRLRAIERLAQAGIPVGVNVAPVIPGLTDHELPAILKAAKEAGACYAGYVPLRLPHSVRTIFEDWLETHRPERKDRVLNSVRDMRDGELNDASFGSRMHGTGARADNIESLFDLFTRKYGFKPEHAGLSTDKFRRPGDQMNLF